MKVQELDEDLYQAPVTLWVEDHLTRVFLMDLWQDQDIRVRAGGGREGVRHFMSCAPASRKGRFIVGLVDRDFSADNTDRWQDPQTHTLRTPTHELENLLLDFDALARIAGERSAAELKEEARRHATDLVWWMACKSLLNDAYLAFTANFPRDAAAPPSENAPRDADAAADHLLSSNSGRQTDGWRIALGQRSTFAVASRTWVMIIAGRSRATCGFTASLERRS